MSIAEMKQVIYGKVEKLSSEDQLYVVLDFLKTFETKKENAVDIEEIFNKANNRYSNTLQKLAQ